jgi:hypothetical protein
MLQSEDDYDLQLERGCSNVYNPEIKEHACLPITLYTVFIVQVYQTFTKLLRTWSRAAAFYFDKWCGAFAGSYRR